ncbi:hypothetical protein [Prosthecomicrobium sp. N25]|uniref:hypothetical protein n=1 Tax=Prosthecomicrobium sp. N25 TaxID=3129254 RepID=UPI0030784FC7
MTVEPPFMRAALSWPGRDRGPPGGLAVRVAAPPTVMKILAALPLLGLILAACSEGAAVPADPTGRRGRDAEPFPLAGRWVWASGARGMPTGDVGCDAGAWRLSVRPSAIDMERGAWRTALLAIQDWRSDAPGQLRLSILDNGPQGRRRAVLHLAVEPTGFVRLAAVTDERDAAVPGERWAGLFPLIRCADEATDLRAALRGTVLSDGRSLR